MVTTAQAHFANVIREAAEARYRLVYDPPHSRRHVSAAAVLMALANYVAFLPPEHSAVAMLNAAAPTGAARVPVELRADADRQLPVRGHARGLAE